MYNLKKVGSFNPLLRWFRVNPQFITHETPQAPRDVQPGQSGPRVPDWREPRERLRQGGQGGDGGRQVHGAAGCGSVVYQGAGRRWDVIIWLRTVGPVIDTSG